jgi:hypothetical protein
MPSACIVGITCSWFIFIFFNMFIINMYERTGGSSDQLAKMKKRIRDRLSNDDIKEYKRPTKRKKTSRAPFIYKKLLESARDTVSTAVGLPPEERIEDQGAEDIPYDLNSENNININNIKEASMSGKDVEMSRGDRMGSYRQKAEQLRALKEERLYSTRAINAEIKKLGGRPGTGYKRKRRSYRRGYKRPRRTAYRGRGGKGVVVTPYGTLTGLGHYSDERNSFGQTYGAMAGGMAQDYFRSVTGLGSYHVNSNSLTNGTDPPQIVNTFGEGAVTLRHREYIGDLFSGALVPGTTITDFTLAGFTLNPGNQSLFPWLWNIAINFQEYELRGMIVELKSLTSVSYTHLTLPTKP